MKRPQSASHHRNYIAMISNDDGGTVQQAGRHFIKLGKKAMFNPMTASNDLSRMLPKKIQQDKERLYCETLQLKTNLNEISQENLRLKTKLATLQREKDKLNKTEEPPLTKGKSSNFSNLNSKSQKQNGMLNSLKKMIRQAREENEILKSDLAKIKRSIRYTKINEVEIEKQTMLEENKRMAKLVQQLQGQLTSRLRQDEQIKHMCAQLEEKNRELKEVTADNIKYEEILEDMEFKNKQVSERLLVSERKWQRDLSVEKRKIDQLNRQIELLKHEIKMINEQLEDEKKRAAQTKKNLRPASSHTSQNIDLKNIKIKPSKQKEEALKLNQKLKQELQLAKKKLAQSENQLVNTDKNVINKLGLSKDQTFELVLTKNEANEFMRQDSDDQGLSQYQQSPPSKNINQLPLEEKSKSKRKSQTRAQNESRYSSPHLNDIRQLLTYRMRYTRYPFNQLKLDIEGSPLSTFAYQDLINMLESEPFFLSQNYASQFLKVCYGRNDIQVDDELDSKILLKNLRAVIDDFEMIDEDEEEKMLYKIAQFMTKHRSELENQFKKVKDRHKCITKAQLMKVLHKFRDINEQEINLAICYISINAETLQAISYTDLLDRFYITAGDQPNHPQYPKSDELSLGENEDLDEGELIADDQLV